MRGPAILILASGICDLASAAVCTQIGNDKDRLACFDATHACAAIQSDSERLSCFDGAYIDPDPVDVQVSDQGVPHDGQMEADTSVEPSPLVENSDDGKKAGAAEIYASPEEFAERNTSGAVKEEGLTATILEVTTNPRNIDYLWLDNGHVWRETENSRVRFKTGRKVRIEEGILRSFNLTMEGTDKIVKVRRVK